MVDVVVTVPRSFGLDRWIDEGQLPGEPDNGEDYDFYLYGKPPKIKAGERVYCVYNGALRGYAPLVMMLCQDPRRYQPGYQLDKAHYFGAYSLVRRDGAVAVTIPEFIPGFRGWRERWWDRAIEVPFPNWQDEWACIGFTRPHAPTKAQSARARAGKAQAALWSEQEAHS